jgi:hypothetical protein
MGTQMLFVLLAIIMFSTIFLGTFNAVFMNAEIVYNGSYRLQAQKLIDFYFQRIDCELLQAQFDGSSSTNFGTVFTTYSNYTEQNTFESITYTVNIDAKQCDQFGDITKPSVLFRRLDIIVNFVPSGVDTLFVGTSANPMSKIFADNGLY